MLSTPPFDGEDSDRRSAIKAVLDGASLCQEPDIGSVAGWLLVGPGSDLTSEPFPVHEAASELPSCKGNFDVDPAPIRGRK